MSGLESPGVAVWPYVLVGGLTKIACAGLEYWYANTTGREPDIGSTPITILAVGVGIGWYSYRVNRPMQPREMIKFASGTAFVDLILSIMIIAAPKLWVGEHLSMRNIGLTSQDVVPLGIVILFATLTVFAVSLLFAWIMTRRLPILRKEPQH